MPIFGHLPSPDAGLGIAFAERHNGKSKSYSVASAISIFSWVKLSIGRKTPVALFSMATSSGEDLPRHIEFLFSCDTLNLAISPALPRECE